MAIGDNLEPGMGGGGTQNEVWRMRDQDGNIILVNVSLLGGLQEALRKYPNLAPVSRQANQATVGQLGPGMVAADPFSVGGMGGNGSNGGFDALADGRLPTPEDLGPRAQTVTPAAFGGQLEQQAPFGAFSNYLGAYGLGSSDPRSAARTFAESQYNPLRSAFAGQQLLQPIQEGDPNQGNEFASFLAQGGINPRKRLGDAFRGLQSAAGQSTLDPGSIFADALDAQTGGEGGEAVDIFNLARQIQRSSYSPLISGRFTGQSNDELFNRFAAQRARAGTVGGGGQNTLDFARSQFGLGGLGF